MIFKINDKVSIKRILQNHGLTEFFKPEELEHYYYSCISQPLCDTRYVDQGPKEWVLVGHGRAGPEEADVGPGAQNGTAHGPTWARAPDRAGT